MTGHQIRFFVERSGAGVNWRLLAPNNREAGRGARAHPDEASCRAALLELRAAADRITHRTRRAAPSGWVWELQLDGEVVAESARPFDRLIRCQQVLTVVAARIQDAPLGRPLPETAARRRGRVGTDWSDHVRGPANRSAGVNRRSVPPTSDTAVALSSSCPNRSIPDIGPSTSHREIA